MKKRGCFSLFALFCVVAAGCSGGFDDSSEKDGASGKTDSAGAIYDDGSTTDYDDESSAGATGFVEDDLYENFSADGTVYVRFDGTAVSAWLGDGSSGTVTASTTETSLGTVFDKKITVVLSGNAVQDEAGGTDESSNGVIIQYKGTGKIKYVLSGTYTGTVFIKNKGADAAVVLNNVSITSDSGAGPVLRLSSELRTFIVVPESSENMLCDTRVLNQSQTMYDDKKGSVYAKGALIFTGESSESAGGTLTVTNSGYKHAIYSKDYIRIADVKLNAIVEGTTGRDCMRSLNAVIIDGGTISLTGNGTVTDDESAGIKVEGEDADEDDLTVEYTAGAGFVIINGGTITINTVAKGITAHWKSDESAISSSGYTQKSNTSLLCGNLLDGTSATVPDPYVEINGGKISITTTGTPYEDTSTGAKCSPEGIEAKGNLTINAGTLSLCCTDDAINAGGSIRINGGAVYAYSSKNDAIDANGSGGITISGGVVVAIGINSPECAFDCDSYPLKIEGGLLVGLGTNNYTAPKNCTQSTVVLSSSYYGSADTTMAVTDSGGTPVFAYTLPSSTGTIMVLSSPKIEAGTTYTVKSGVSASGGTRFHNLYTSLPEISGGTSRTTFCTSSGNYVATVSSAGTNPGAQEGTRTR